MGHIYEQFALWMFTSLAQPQHKMLFVIYKATQIRFEWICVRLLPKGVRKVIYGWSSGVPMHPPMDFATFTDLLKLVNLGMCQKATPP